MGAGRFQSAVNLVEMDFDCTVEWPRLGGYGHGSSLISLQYFDAGA